MLQRAGKHFVSFFKLYTLKIPWSNHQLIELVNVLVVSYCGKMLQYLSSKAFSHLVLTLLGQMPPVSPSKRGTPTALIFLERCSPLATTFTAVHWHLSIILHLLRLYKAPSRASSPTCLLFSFGGVTRTHQDFGSPQSCSAVENHATVQTYQRKWGTHGQVSSYLRPLAVS